MNDIPFYDPNKDGLFDRANRRNHTELFVIVQIPDHFTFIIDFEYLGAVGFYGILVTYVRIFWWCCQNSRTG